MRVVGYARVSTIDQYSHGHSLDYQSDKIKRYCDRMGWKFDLVVDNRSAKNLKRPVLVKCLEELRVGKYKSLVVTRLDRLVRRVRDACFLGEEALTQQWGLVVIDSGIDTSTPFGKAQLHMMATFAELERDLNSMRTKEGLVAARAKGVRLGRPTLVPRELAAEIICLHEEHGLTFKQITERFNQEGRPTVTGVGTWQKTVVYDAYARVRYADDYEETQEKIA